MAKLTVLDLVQDALGAMDSDSVNDINDTVESLQVVQIVKECFEDLVSEFNLGPQSQLIQLESPNTPGTPTLLRMTDSTSLIEWINYGLGPDNKLTAEFVDFGEGGSYIGYGTAAFAADHGGTEAFGSLTGVSLVDYTIDFIGTTDSGNLTVILSADETPDEFAFISITLDGITYLVDDASSFDNGLTRTWFWGPVALEDGAFYSISLA